MTPEPRVRHLPELPTETALGLLALLDLLGRLGIKDGARRQHLSASWTPLLPTSAEALISECDILLRQAAGPSAPDPLRCRSSPRRLAAAELALAAARASIEAGWRVLRRPRDWAAFLPCPQWILLRGRVPEAPFWTAVFHSRTARRPDPAAPWIRALHTVLTEPEFQLGGWAASDGPLSYQLVASFAAAKGAPLLRVDTDWSAAAVRLLRAGPCAMASAPFAAPLVLTCAIGGAACPKAIRMVCRDRLLAAVSDRQVALELRAPGNLVEVLTAAQETDPRPLRLFASPRGGARCAGNRLLFERFPQATRFVAAPAPGLSIRRPGSAEPPECQPVPTPPVSSAPIATALDAACYLYHYTRACPGPWPGQTAQDHHLALLANCPEAAHSAFDTLCRILEEGRLRASARMVRGTTPVISWTARGFADLDRLRRWRPGLLRWTVEPWGLAVRRATLQRLGAKPAVYLPPAQFARLRPADRFRYQRHQPPQCAWKQEREWRLAGDLDLNSLAPEDVLILVPDRAAARALTARVACRFPVLAANGEEKRDERRRLVRKSDPSSGSGIDGR